MSNHSNTPLHPNGFEIQPLRVSYTAHIECWAAIHSALQKTNFEEIPLDDTARSVLTFWRDGLGAALAGAIGLAYLPVESETNFQDDIHTYLTDGTE